MNYLKFRRKLLAIFEPVLNCHWLTYRRVVKVNKNLTMHLFQILATHFPWFTDAYERMPRDGRETQWRTLCENELPEKAALPDKLDDTFTPIQRLMVVRGVRGDRVLQAAEHFIQQVLSKRYDVKMNSSWQWFEVWRQRCCWEFFKTKNQEKDPRWCALPHNVLTPRQQFRLNCLPNQEIENFQIFTYCSKILDFWVAKKLLRN